MPDGRGRRVLLIVAIVLVVVAVVGALTLRAVLTPERLRAEVVKATGEATGLDVALDAAKLSIFPFGVSLTGLRIAGDTEDDPAFVQLESGLVRLQLGPLLRRKVVVDRVRLTRPSIHLRQEGAQVVLPGKLGVPPGAPPAGAKPGGSGAAALPAAAGFSASIRAIEIVDASLRVATPGGTDDVALTGIDISGNLEVERGGNRLVSRGEMSLAGLSLAALEMYRETLDELHPVVRFDLEYRADESTLGMKELALAAGPLDLRFHGELTGVPTTPAIALVLDPKTIELAELLPLVPPAAWPEGRQPEASGPVTVSATVRGPLGDPASPPDVDVKLRLEGAKLGLKGFAVGVKDLKGTIDATPTRLRLAGLEGKLGEGTFAVDGEVVGLDDPETTRYDLAVRAKVDLDLVGQSGFAPEGVELAGRLDVDVKARGRAADPQGVALSGQVDLDGASVKDPALPVPLRDVAGSVTLAGGTATIRRFTGSLGRSRFEMTGTAEDALSPSPRVRLQGKSPLLDLTELTPPPPGSPGAPAGGPGGTPSPEPPLLPPSPRSRSISR